MKDGKFTKGVERLVDPVNVGTLHFIQSFNDLLPKGIQKKMVAASGKVTPYMGFVVEPYSSFLCFEIKDLDRARAYLPEGFQLVKTRIFEDSEPGYYCIFGCFNAHTSGFWGSRIELYLIAEDQKTGLLTWIILDHDTNTITYSPESGLKGPNASGSFNSIDYEGRLFVDFVNNDGRELKFSFEVAGGEFIGLDQRLWIEGNLSVAYGKNIGGDNDGVFSLVFDPGEFKEALRIPVKSLQIEVNSWFPGLIFEEPVEVVCFPYAQHFLSASPGISKIIKSREELDEAWQSVDFSELKVFSTRYFRNLFLLGGFLSVLSNILLITLLILK